MRRLSVLFAVIVCCTGLGLVLGAPAGAQVDPEVSVDPGFVTIVEVSGLLDDVLADFIEDSIDDATASGAEILVLQLDSRATVISDERLNEVAAAIVDSEVPVAVWVGPSGATAAGGAAQLAGVGDRLAVSIGSELGPTGPLVLDPRFGTVYGDAAEQLVDDRLEWDEAILAGVVPCDRVEVDELGNPLDQEEQLARCAAPTIGDFLVDLDELGFRSQVVLEEVTDDDGSVIEVPRRQPLTRAEFRGLPLVDQLFHTVASPPVAYLLLISGLGLLLFEYFSLGIGIAGLVGAVCLALAGFGLDVIPFRGWALALIVLSMLAFAIDVQTAVPRAWTVIGSVLFAVGTLFLYPESDVAMSWIPMLIGITAMVAIMARGMPIMVRGRFSTTVIPRDFLVGRSGQVVAVTGSDPDTAIVEVDGARWEALADGGVHDRQAVEVAGLDGLTLRIVAADAPVQEGADET